jgi:hypothetical protein
MTSTREKLNQLTWHRVASYLESRYESSTLIGVSYNDCLTQLMQDDLLLTLPGVSTMTQKTLVNMRKSLGLMNWNPPRNSYTYTLRQQAEPVEKFHVPPMSEEKINELLMRHVKPFLKSILADQT